jgi:hypothetical protein
VVLPDEPPCFIGVAAVCLAAVCFALGLAFVEPMVAKLKQYPKNRATDWGVFQFDPTSGG